MHTASSVDFYATYPIPRKLWTHEKYIYKS